MSETLETVHSLLRQAAITIDLAQHASRQTKPNSEFLQASTDLRYARRHQIELTTDVFMAGQYLKSLDFKLADIRDPARDSVTQARRYVAEASAAVRNALEPL